MNPPFMPAPAGVFPLHAQGGNFGTENVIEPFFNQCWDYLNDGGCIQGIFHSCASQTRDSILQIIDKNLPSGWSYKIKHVFPVKEIPLELYKTGFLGENGCKKWSAMLEKKGFYLSRFFMVTIRNNGKNGLQKEELSDPRLYNIVCPPTQLSFLKKKNLKPKLLEKPISEEQFPTIGHLMRQSRYNYGLYLTLKTIFS
ncbi:MAG: hypothetical protein PHD95_04895 [Candidatus ainarchaeum sp.]|nr:hypothetical protein [Candidatus ainarchaeum sp.]